MKMNRRSCFNVHVYDCYGEFSTWLSWKKIYMEVKKVKKLIFMMTSKSVPNFELLEI